MDDLISRQKAIDILYDFAGCIVDTPNGDYQKAYQAYRHRLETLPSAQPERKGCGCEYCCEDSGGYVLSIEKNGHAYVQNGKLALRAKGWWGECAINFCPMCGRKLRGEQE